MNTMTFTEILALGKARLVAYEPRLKVKGRKPFSSASAGVVQRSYDCSLAAVHKAEVQSVIDAVLDELVAMTEGFVMSDPEPPVKGSGTSDQESVSHNELILTFRYGYDIRTNINRLWVECWYYPV